MSSSIRTSVKKLFLLPLILVPLVLVPLFLTSLAFASSAEAAQAAPAWQITTDAFPTVLQPGIGRAGKYSIAVENIGGATSEGELMIKDVLPQGLSVTKLLVEPEIGSGGRSECHESGGEVTCGVPDSIVPSGFAVVNIFVQVTGSVGSLANVVTVSGGNAPTVTEETSTRLGAAHETGPPGISHFRFEATGPAGEPVTQAGAHPTFLTTSLLFNNMYTEGIAEPAKPVQGVKDLVFYMPLGFLGNPTVTATCPAALVEVSYEKTGCPPSSRVGTILPMILSNVFADSGDPTHEFGIYNVTPEKGVAAEFAFAELGYTFFIYATVVRHDGAYMLRVATPGLPPVAYMTGLVATFDGDIQEHYLSGEEEFTFDRGSFLTDPSNCQASTQAREATVAANTWEDPNPELPLKASVNAFPLLEGCGKLQFSPTLSVTPETTQAEEPSGYAVGLEVPQAPNDASGLGTPPFRNVEIKLPAGTMISPSSANGLLPCQETGPKGINIEGAESEATGPDGLQHLVNGHCPNASQIATVTASTPLLREQLSGHLFLAEPDCGGAGQHECTEEDARDGGLFGLYLELEGPQSGVVIKVKGHATVDPGTGQVTAIFDENPQFPVSKLVASMKRGPRAPLANPQTCGTAASTGTLSFWGQEAGAASAAVSSIFNVDWSGAGAPCPASMPFAPSFTAGTTSPVAATTSPFTLAIKREDREQNVEKVTTTLPEGLLANLSKVTRCPEPQASQASLSACPSSSQVGTITVSVGSGSEPYYETGKVFFTGPYESAPFGLSIVVPAVAGPFNLGNVLVRTALHIDPHTAQVTAVSGALPQKLDGVPLRIRTLDVTLGTQEFTLNPTNCSKLEFNGTITSTQGATATVSSPFQVGGCRGLTFKPKFSVATQHNGELKGHGASLKVDLQFPNAGPQSGAAGEANTKSVKVSLPRALPARLTTLQKACTAAQFESNPAGCPEASFVGAAVAHTPILANPLAGPAILVSHGGEAFPDLDLVLQGENITIILTGNTSIKHNITTSTFASVPDAPVSNFELTLPEGPHSALSANENLCQAKLVMPTAFVAQNGATLNQETHIEVEGFR